MGEGGGQNQFRNALGAFATGVTIVTTVDDAGAPVGVTASSFNSVSLDPPLVLWSLAKSAQSRDAFCSSGHFAIHVLADSQEAASNRFACSGEDKFAGIAWLPGLLGSPVFDEYAAVFQCQTRYTYEGGDHVILVGEVVAFERRDAAPLLFHSGRYAEHRPRAPVERPETVDLQNGQFTDDFLFYLIARAYFQSSRPARRKLAALGLDQQQHAVLVSLSMRTSATASEIQGMLAHSEHAPSENTLARMIADGHCTMVGEAYELTALGRNSLIEVLAVSKAFEADIADQMSRGELAEVRRLLRRIIDLTGPEVPIAWRD
jgi:3-hydroxy-9,10-secoandrosta-1,3,5(10)-triene-9,17-dione monooxygenase reductase component